MFVLLLYKYLSSPSGAPYLRPPHVLVNEHVSPCPPLQMPPRGGNDTSVLLSKQRLSHRGEDTPRGGIRRLAMTLTTPSHPAAFITSTHTHTDTCTLLPIIPLAVTNHFPFHETKQQIVCDCFSGCGRLWSCCSSGKEEEEEEEGEKWH